MRILYDSRQQEYKTPFGVVRAGQSCILHIDIPTACGACGVLLMLEDCDGRLLREIPFEKQTENGGYTRWHCSFAVDCGLYFYYFVIDKATDAFRLFRQGSQTNIEAGDKWQLSCIPADFTVPDFYRGAVMYQIMPDRFYKAGECDLSEKLRPFTVHAGADEEPSFTADAEGNWCNDFFGGNLNGIREKLPYLQELGVQVLYLNPIFMAFTNHRYDTADYKRVDPMLGTKEDFAALCDDAHRMGMRVILDCAFSHTGSNSIYFDAKHVFGGGAVSDPDSPYREWYRFSDYPHKYESWWGMPTLPCVEELKESYVNYIIEAPDSVVAQWLALGADGYRLDVVDELPDEFVLLLKKRIRALSPEAILIGEVWEDASNKRAYDVSRRYFVDAELDSVMNYPWRKAILDYSTGKDDGTALGEAIMSLAENYPPEVLACVMNCLGSHDTPRLLTALGDGFHGTREEESRRRMSTAQRDDAVQRSLTAAFLQFTLPGMPSIYYGDEAGMEGFSDPFCRRCYPWGREDRDLQSYYRELAKLKRDTPALRSGQVLVLQAGQGRICFRRTSEAQTAQIYVNQSMKPWLLPDEGLLRFGSRIYFNDGHAALQPGGFCAVVQKR